MPSMRQQSWNAASASSSVIDDVLGAPGVLEPRVLGADAGIVEARRDRMRLDDLAVRVLQQVACDCRAARRAGPPVSDAAWRPVSMPSPPASTPISRTLACGMYGWKMPIALEPPPTHAMTASGWRPACSRHLRHALVADHALEIAHHHRVRMRAGDGADDVERVLDVGHPVAHRLVERVLQRLRLPDSTGTTVAPSSFMRKTFCAWRSTSSEPM